MVNCIAIMTMPAVLSPLEMVRGLPMFQYLVRLGGGHSIWMLKWTLTAPLRNSTMRNSGQVKGPYHICPFCIALPS
jgi:hypothetical protein